MTCHCFRLSVFSVVHRRIIRVVQKLFDSFKTIFRFKILIIDSIYKYIIHLRVNGCFGAFQRQTGTLGQHKRVPVLGISMKSVRTMHLTVSVTRFG